MQYDNFMTMAEAKQHRSALMAERKNFVRLNTEEVFEQGFDESSFNLCEH